RLVPDKGVRALGAPPVELEPAVAPVAAFPLPQGGRHVAVFAGVLVEAERELPAHVGLPVHEPLAGLERGPVQRAAGAAGETRAVEEDAGVVDEAGDARAVLLHPMEAAAASLAPVLPLLVGEPRRRRRHGGEILVVDEVGAVAAAALLELGGRPGEHALTSAAVDARPRRQEERDIEDPRPFFVGVLEADVLGQVVRDDGGHGWTLRGAAMNGDAGSRSLPSRPMPAVDETNRSRWVRRSRHAVRVATTPRLWREQIEFM